MMNTHQLKEILQKMEGQDESGRWMYQCIYCRKPFSSSQGIAGHTKAHLREGWVKGTPHNRVFYPYPEQQQQQQVVSETDSTNADAQAARPPSPTRRPPPPKHYLRVRDLKILARLKARLTKEEDEIIVRLVDSAMEQAKQSSRKNTEVEAIPNKDSEAAPIIGTTNNDAMIVEDSGDESKNM